MRLLLLTDAEQYPGGLAPRAGVPGLEPRLTEPETVGLPITPYPMGRRSRRRRREYLTVRKGVAAPPDRRVTPPAPGRRDAGRGGRELRSGSPAAAGAVRRRPARRNPTAPRGSARRPSTAPRWPSRCRPPLRPARRPAGTPPRC